MCMAPFIDRHSISRYWRATVAVSISIVVSSIAVQKVKTKLFRRIILLLRLLLHKNGGMTMYGLWSGYKGKESFYEKLGFKFIPHEFCGSAMRKVIRN